MDGSEAKSLVDLDSLILTTYRVINGFASAEAERMDVLGTLYRPVSERDVTAVCKLASAFRDFAEGLAILSSLNQNGPTEETA